MKKLLFFVLSAILLSCASDPFDYSEYSKIQNGKNVGLSSNPAARDFGSSDITITYNKVSGTGILYINTLQMNYKATNEKCNSQANDIIAAVNQNIFSGKVLGIKNYTSTNEIFISNTKKIVLAIEFTCSLDAFDKCIQEIYATFLGQRNNTYFSKDSPPLFMTMFTCNDDIKLSTTILSKMRFLKREEMDVYGRERITQYAIIWDYNANADFELSIKYKSGKDSVDLFSFIKDNLQ